MSKPHLHHVFQREITFKTRLTTRLSKPGRLAAKPCWSDGEAGLGIPGFGSWPLGRRERRPGDLGSNPSRATTPFLHKNTRNDSFTTSRHPLFMVGGIAPEEYAGYDLESDKRDTYLKNHANICRLSNRSKTGKLIR